MEAVDHQRDKKPMVEQFAEEQGHKLVFLPVHHPELNPIELIWATVKNHCGGVFSNSTSFKDQRRHLEESFRNDITREHCQNVYQHVQAIEEKYWQTDLMVDDDIEIEDGELSPL
jgi:transposase